ncbi:hypothetical protein K1T71_004502 [Dendrolimus kikuchii]|uniref:Uncharacterized protein n=1 Tax=Dendrolimus kikuchii TaxID=765133 RepID=A0ACC1D8A4_9NEOP|nr:hypothetical protein K1T71_004502 [Dendrolimus kikuchii]
MPYHLAVGCFVASYDRPPGRRKLYSFCVPARIKFCTFIAVFYKFYCYRILVFEDIAKKSITRRLALNKNNNGFPCAAPQIPQDVQIVRYDVNNAGIDSYNFAWELSDGTKHEEQGQLKNQGTDNEGIAVQGQYSWLAPDGVVYTVTYVADENGFQPQIEQGPGGAIPPGVIASLAG